MSGRDTKLERHLQSRLEAGSKLLVPYVTAGLPSPQKFVQLVSDLSSFVDAIEIGIPFSDPVMDGPVIQEASGRALAEGVNLSTALRLIREAQRYSVVPLVVMTYYNPVYRFGLERFSSEAREAGIEGVIVPDLPLEEGQDLEMVLSKSAIAHIQLVAPTTSSERAARLSSESSGFVYAISRLGVTGEREDLSASAREVVEKIRPSTKLPVLLGIGITNAGQAAAAAEWADGVIIGSALMKRVLNDDVAGALTLVKEIRKVIADSG